MSGNNPTIATVDRSRYAISEIRHDSAMNTASCHFKKDRCPSFIISSR